MGLQQQSTPSELQTTDDRTGRRRAKLIQERAAHRTRRAPQKGDNIQDSAAAMHVAVVGAGLSGLLCARRLGELVPNLRISVLEWGRGPGGRTARRRVALEQGSELSFDHAAPFFTVASGTFQDQLKRWEAAGAAAPWPEAGADVWVGTPSSNAIARHLVAQLEAAGASMLFGHHVTAAEHDGAVWRVRAQERATDTTAELTFDALVLSDKLLVLPNTYSALAPSEVGPLALPHTLASTGTVVLLLALRVSAALGAALPPQTTVVEYADQPAAGAAMIARAVHESAKPGRDADAPYDQWVVHSTAGYAAAHLVGGALDDEAAVLAEMQAAFLGLLAGGGGGPGGSSGAGAAAEEALERLLLLEQAVVHASVMAWDHAQPSPGTGSRVADALYRLDSARRAGVCGDFFGQGQAEGGCGGVEAAALSGLALADGLAPHMHIHSNANMHFMAGAGGRSKSDL
jgi:renalase